jgi:pimeloyl-ACP methyl ester carboxylesterase
MTTFVLFHGGGSSAWDWNLVTPLLERAGHDVVAVDLPIEDENAVLADYVAAVVAAVTGVGTNPASPRRETIVVGHSLGGFTAPLVADELGADGLVYLTAMIPLSGETCVDWWAHTGHDREGVSDDPQVAFFTGVPDDLAREARVRERDQQGKWMSVPFFAEPHPSRPTRALLCSDDQFFPAVFMARQIRERLGIAPVEIPGGHYAMLSEPRAVAAALNVFAREVRSAGD